MINLNIIIILFLIFGFLVFNNNNLNFSEPTKGEILVYPDQLKLNDNHWLTGIGKTNDGQTITFGGTYKENTIPTDNKLLIKGYFEWKQIGEATNAGEFNFKKFYRYKKIKYRGTSKDIYIERQNNRSIVDKLHAMRAKILNHSKTLPHWIDFNIRSLLFGDFDSDESNLRASLSNLGIIHIFCISGFHIYFFINLLYKLTSMCLIPKEKIDWLLLGLLPIYCVIAGFGAGIIRSTLLVMIKICKDKCDLQLSKHDCFGITLLIHTFIMPFVLFTIAGQLSYLLSYGLLIMKDNDTWKKSILINILSLPILIYHYYSFSWLTFIANIFIAPLFEIAIIPATLVALILQNIKPLLQTLNDILDLFYKNIINLGGLKSSQIIYGKLPIIIALLLIGLILIELSFDYKLSKYIIFLFVLIFIINKFPISGEVTYIDIGQGDSILITTPIFRKTCLIDTGGKLNFNHKESSNNRVQSITIPYLKHQGISKIDYVFLSHQDADHIGDLSILLKNFPVERVCFADGMQDNVAVANKLRPFVQEVKYDKLKINDVIKLDSQTSFKVLWPNKISDGTNETSLTLLANIAQTTFLFSGDLNRENECKLFKDKNHIDYLKAGHHGSKTASDPKFLKQISPNLVIISAGRHNRYGHPHPETIHNLQKLNIPYVSTAEHGMISWKYNNFDNKRWQTFSEDKINED